jgi:hypothetical protein
MVFPDKKFLYADELQETFEFMRKKNMYKNIIYYMESCFSGSIFTELNPELNIYALTAASPKEQSLATFCYPDDYVKGYKAGVKDGYDDALLKLQESNPNTEIPSTETLFKIFDLLFAADKRMKDTSSCYMNTYQYYVNSIVKHWNDENKSITQNEDDYM